MDVDYLAKLIGSLALVIGLLLVTLFILKRKGFTVAGALRIDASVSLGAKERIMLIRCGKQQLLVGVTPSNIRTLHVLPDEFDASEFENSSETKLKVGAPL